MSESRAAGVAIVGGQRGDGPAAPDGAWYAADDVGAVERGVRDGHVRRVVFAELDDLLEAVWSRAITLDTWLARGVQVEVAPSISTTDALVARLASSWAAWTRRHRRRQLWAGLVLSAVAIAAAFVLHATVSR